MGSRRFYTPLLWGIILFGLPALSRAQTATNTPTNSPTSTASRTPTGTPTDTLTPTITFTPNATLTPPCGASAGTFGNNGLGSSGTSINTMRAGLYTLSAPATVYSLFLYSSNPGSQVMTGIYGGSSGNIGSLIVGSSPQTMTTGWNGFPLTPTYLAAGTYWLAYSYKVGGYTPWYTSTASVSVLAYTSSAFAFGSMPGSMPAPSYGADHESIYAVYCNLPTSTPTPSFTPTSTPTFTPTFTPTNTGTMPTFTPSSTSTSSPTLTPTATFTFTPTATPSDTPNPSLTPDCGASAQIFGNSNTAGAPQTATTYGLRACVYNLPVTGNVETISLYCLPQSAGTTAVVGIYTSQSVSLIGSLITQSDPAKPQAMVSGWNAFSIPATVLVPGNYWLAYIFSGPVSYKLNYQTSGAPITNTLAWATTQVNSFTFHGSAASYPVSYNVGTNIYDPIYASYCPGSLATSTPTNSPTATPSSTITYTATLTPTPTITGTPTDSPTVTLTGTVTNTPTPTATGTPSASPTSSSTSTPTNSLTATPTITPSGTPTGTPTVTATFTITSTPTLTPTSTITATPTASPTASSTSSPSSTATASPSPTVTNTPNLTLTATSSPTNSPTLTPTYTATLTPSSTPTASPTLTPTSTSTGPPTPSITASPTSSTTPTLSLTVTNTLTFTPTATPSPTPTGTSPATLTSTPTTAAVPTPLLYPNPLRGPGPVHLTLTFDKPHDYVTCKIFTTAFRKVYESTTRFVPAGPFNFDLDFSGLNGGAGANGFYYVVVTTPSDRWISKLLILK